MQRFARHRPVIRLLGLALAAAACGPAQAWDWSTAAPLPSDSSAPAALSVPDANGFWALGRGLVHYAADGHADVVRDSAVADSALSVALPNGGVLFTNGPHNDFSGFDAPVSCVLRAYDAQGTPRWQDTVSSDAGFCQRVGLDASGILWVKTGTPTGALHRFALDGVELPAVTGPFADFSVRQDGVYAVTGSAPAHVLALNHAGSAQWNWLDSDVTHLYRRIARGDDGDIYAAGFVNANGTNDGDVLLSSVDANGKLRWSTRAAGVPASTIAALAPSGDGALYVLALEQNTPVTLTLLRVNADGSVAWTHSIVGASGCNAYDPYGCAFAVANGAALFAVGTAGGERVLRYAADGTQVYAQDVGASVTALRVLANGHALVALRQSNPVALSALELDASGANVAPPPAATIDALAQTSTGSVAPDGSSYLLTTVAGVTALTKLATDGSIAWRQPVIPAFHSSASADRVCVGSDSAVACYAAADGSALWNATLDSSNGTPLRVLADDTVEAVELSATGGTHAALRVFAPDGTATLRSDLGAGSNGATIAANGTVVLFDASYQTLLAYDRSGALVYSVAVPGALVPALASQQPAVTLGADATALVTLNKQDPNTATPSAWLVSPHGDTRWQQTLQPTQAAYPYGAAIEIQSWLGDDGSAYVGVANALPQTPLLSYDLTVLAFAPSGQLRWQAPHVLQPRAGFALRKDAQSGNLLVLGLAQDRLTHAVLDDAAGTLVGFGVEACPAEVAPAGARFANDFCSWQDLTLTPDGTLRATANVASETARSGPYAFALHNAAAPFGTLVAAPAGFDGAWYAPYEGGQGFLLDEIYGQLFVSWFTYAAGDNSNDPSHLIWYTAQTSCCVTGQTFFDGTLYQPAPGVFASGSVAVTAIGTVRLYFSDCEHAVLSYTNDIGSGMIALRRLTPAPIACGNGAPAEIASTTTNGFDTQQSGSWFDPATSGQGLDIVVLPPAGSFGGLIYGAWFTFDPAGAVNDAAQLQWFTLQGDLSQGANGSVQLPILQTLGGTFDGAPTNNTNVVGHATLTFAGCDHATLVYQFDATPQAHAFAALSGTSNLVKIGGCESQ